MYLRKKGNVWYFAIMVDMADGTRKRIERAGGKTKTEAREAAMALVRKQDKFGRLQEPKEITFGEYLDRWFKNQVHNVLAKNTEDSYRRIVLQLKEAMGNQLLYRISPAMLQSYFNRLREQYSYATLRQLRNVMVKLFNDAVKLYEYLERNPAQAVKIHVPADENKKTTKVSYFSPEDMRKIIRQFHENPVFYIPIMLAYHMGMRMGECLALRWTDVDFTNQMIHVCRNQYDRHGTAEVKKRTKSKKDRYIEMDQAICDILKAWKQYQKYNQAEYGPYYKKSDYICTHLDGTKTVSNNLRYFNLWCAKENLQGSFHSLRHTHATELLEAGMDIDYVSKRLGHSSILLTSQTYVHVSNKRREKGIKTMDKIFLSGNSLNEDMGIKYDS